MPERLATGSAVSTLSPISDIEMPRFYSLSPLAVVVFTTACVSLPNGPSVMVLPGNGMNFDQFRYDDADCQQFAYAQIGGVSANQAAIDSGVTSAAVGTALGAATGAAYGGGEGAAIGAATGLVAGTISGTGAANMSGYATQQHFDTAYIQCMYAKGHQVPVYGDFSRIQASPPVTPIPPPPPGLPPPPPPN